MSLGDAGENKDIRQRANDFLEHGVLGCCPEIKAAIGKTIAEANAPTPDVFTLLEDGIAYVVENGLPQNDPGGSRSLAFVEKREEAAVIEAAEICPGECIFIEMNDQNLTPASS